MNAFFKKMNCYDTNNFDIQGISFVFISNEILSEITISYGYYKDFKYILNYINNYDPRNIYCADKV